MTFDAIVLAGGGSTRFGGVDKAMLVLEGVSLLDRVLTATKNAGTTVVVGPQRSTVRPVEWTTEQPPSGGPVAGIAAGLAHGDAPIVVILSCDLPWLTDSDVTTLVQDLTGDGHGLRDTDGREQYLVAAYRREALAEALKSIGDPRDKSVRRFLSPLALTWTNPTRAGDDVDTWSDLDD
ncbi:molybdopterin-guanine dinucleotide biosynthesis protein A [Kribbella amoyensis]|uniref:Molybdopterin-guanine dinucleotide biosynthesis protein A n=1 Tax=Kribbella amoyensis TaxID=996641 RepID=A0A561BPL0_9ACTN|nr:molybdenum cofactor guanylyltransferase [Kribbella amoyensis]TWD80794.1 molybdopterin-guanine dinucleotide biosynthesis protein A [Kribbella amoyensis]